MSRLYLMPQGLFFVHLVFANEKACMERDSHEDLFPPQGPLLSAQSAARDFSLTPGLRRNSLR